MNEGNYSLSDIRAVTGNDGMFGGNGSWWIILLFVLFVCGWGGFGGGFGNMGGGGAAQNYVLASDFATIQRQLSDGFNSVDNALDRQNAGICDLGYTQLSLNNGTNMAMMQGFNALGTQLADCCCKTQQNIKDTQYAIATASGDIRGAIKDCCCDTEKQFMQTRFDAQTYNCNTLQAIDKLGDRIEAKLDYAEKQRLIEENQALRLAANNQVLVNQLRPMPVPAYQSCNPWANYAPYGSCGCAG